MDPVVTKLVGDAERKAQRFSAYVRGAVSLTFLVFFTVAHPADLPPHFIWIVYSGLGAYLVLGAASYALAAPRLYRPWFALPLFALDLVVYVAILISAAEAFGMSVAQVAALPPFLLVFILVAQTAMLYSPWAVSLQVLLILVIGAAWIAAGAAGLLQGASAPLPPDRPTFGFQLNFFRVMMIAGAGLVLVLTVFRTRRLLLDAIMVTRRTENLSRYLPGAVAQRAAEQGVEALGRGRIQKAAVLFADIAGFSALAERTEPEALGVLLGALRGIQRRAIEEHGGVVDKYIGDAVMAVFGVPDPTPDDAKRALDAALAMHAAVAEWNAARVRAGERVLRVGIGLHYGDVFAGAIGDDQRLEYATLGDTVNVAQRVEGLTRTLDAPLLVTKEVFDAAGADPARWEALPPQPVRGRSETVAVLRPADADQRRK